jgi:hypothetical protein
MAQLYCEAPKQAETQRLRSTVVFDEVEEKQWWDGTKIRVEKFTHQSTI